MNNMGNAIVMQVTQSSGNTQCNSDTQFPVDGFHVALGVIYNYSNYGSEISEQQLKSLPEQLHLAIKTLSEGRAG